VSELQLLIGGRVYAGWESVSVTRGMEALASAFRLGVSDRRRLTLGDACQVYIGDDLIMTGYLDEYGLDYDAKQRERTWSGRSRVADLVDCSLPESVGYSLQTRSLTFYQLAQQLALPFGIDVQSTLEHAPIDFLTIDPGQTVHTLLELYARAEAAMLLDTPGGGLLITRAGTRRAPTALVRGENILSCQGSRSIRGRFSHYYVLGQQPQGDLMDVRDAAQVVGRATDANMRYRPTTVLADTVFDPAQIQRRAEWQANIDYGQSESWTYTVSGWHHTSGLWEHNTRVPVYDDEAGFEGDELMISQVEYLLDGDGRRAAITVRPPEAFDLVPIPVGAR